MLWLLINFHCIFTRWLEASYALLLMVAKQQKCHFRDELDFQPYFQFSGLTRLTFQLILGAVLVKHLEKFSSLDFYFLVSETYAGSTYFCFNWSVHLQS